MPAWTRSGGFSCVVFGGAAKKRRERPNNNNVPTAPCWIGVQRWFLSASGRLLWKHGRAVVTGRTCDPIIFTLLRCCSDDHRRRNRGSNSRQIRRCRAGAGALAAGCISLTR
ncbi:unnamed protein product [Pleuronectes platessa]|uniref:Uncharacterized protein n=1 Tax=Pleuronectes platessa TaxID=8262 RepID=A0A9N7VWD7_PLEPL|nr:unnamed protein product [Pleuronectes platessa]